MLLILEKSKSLIGADNTGYILMVCANCFWMLGLLFGTEDSRINSIYMGLSRGFAAILLSFLFSKIYNTPIHYPYLPDLYKLTLRNTIMVAQGYLFALSFQYLQVPIVYTISNAGPIAVFIIDYFKNGVQINRQQLYGIIVSTIGIVLAINSHLIYREMGIEEELHSEFKYIQSTLEMRIVVSLLFLGITILWAYAVVLTKSFKSINVIQVNFHLGIMLITVNAIGMMIVPNPVELDLFGRFEVFWKCGFFLGGSAFIYIGSLYLTKKTGNLTIIGFLNVVIGYGISMIRYKETPNLIGAAGSVCIGIGLLLVLIK